MKKQVKKEYALLFCAYVFTKEGLKLAGELKDSELTENDWKIKNIFKRLDFIKYSFLREEVLTYYFTRLQLVKDSQVQMSPLILGLFLLYIYLEFRQATKKFIHLPVTKKELEKLIKDINEQFGLKEDEVKYAYEFALAFFPNKAGLIEFKKLTNRLFGAEYIKELYMLDFYRQNTEINDKIKKKAKDWALDILKKAGIA